MKLSKDDESRIKAGDLKCFKTILNKNLEDLRDQLMIYRSSGSDYDLVLKGQAQIIKEILTLLGN